VLFHILNRCLCGCCHTIVCHLLLNSLLQGHSVVVGVIQALCPLWWLGWVHPMAVAAVVVCISQDRPGVV
jgi:hypothetical protein